MGVREGEETHMMKWKTVKEINMTYSLQKFIRRRHANNDERSGAVFFHNKIQLDVSMRINQTLSVSKFRLS